MDARVARRSGSRVAAVARHQARLVGREWTLPIIYVALPLIVIAFVRPTFELVLSAAYPGANGAEVAVPGQAVLAGFLVVALLGWSMFLDHRWGTWDRIRASPVRPSEVLAGRFVVALAQLTAQFTLVLVGGAVLFHLHAPRGVAPLVVVTLATEGCILAYGSFALAMSRTNPQFDAFATIGALAMCGLGGALVPAELLPRWARPLEPLSPVTWAMRAYRASLLPGVDTSIRRPVLALVAFSCGFAVLAAARYRFDEVRTASTRG